MCSIKGMEIEGKVSYLEGVISISQGEIEGKEKVIGERNV